MGLAHDVMAKVGKTLANVHAGDERLAACKLDIAPSAERLRVESSFPPGEPLPVSATVDGSSLPPSLRWSMPPAIARSFAVVVEDPDAPFPEPFVHWMVYGIPATVLELDGTAAGFPEGQNSLLQAGFTGAAPPPGHGRHAYHFQVFALDVLVDLDHGIGRSTLFERMRGHVVAWGEIVGTYERV